MSLKKSPMDNVIIESIKSNIDDLPVGQRNKAQFWYTAKVPTPAPTPEPVNNCFHAWKWYEGFTENYYFCIDCGMKKYE